MKTKIKTYVPSAKTQLWNSLAVVQLNVRNISSHVWISPKNYSKDSMPTVAAIKRNYFILVTEFGL